MCSKNTNSRYYLKPKYWLIVLALTLIVPATLPLFYAKQLALETSPNYRIPYDSSKDYWLIQQRFEKLNFQTDILLLGDSVIWGEYVLPDSTLSNCLTQSFQNKQNFVNGGINGMSPLAQDGLLRHYGKNLSRKKIILHLNPLWLSDPDIDSGQSRSRNHPQLLPLFNRSTSRGKELFNDRFGYVIRRNIHFFSWIQHIQINYYDNKSIYEWTALPRDLTQTVQSNAYRFPLAPITFQASQENPTDNNRGPTSTRHKAWNENPTPKKEFSWVPLNQSIQWQAYLSIINQLQQQNNNVFVIIGPFNEHMINNSSHEPFKNLKSSIIGWLNEQQIPHLAPKTLESHLYADASHPLSEGYQVLAEILANDPSFTNWINSKGTFKTKDM